MPHEQVVSARKVRIVLTTVIVVVLVGLVVSFVVLWEKSAATHFPTEDELIARFGGIREPLDEVNRMMLSAGERHAESFAVFESHDTHSPQETPEKEEIGLRIRELGIYSADNDFSKNDDCIGYVLTFLYGTHLAYAYCAQPPRYVIEGSVLEADHSMEPEKGHLVYRPLADDWYLTVLRRKGSHGGGR